MTSSLPSDIHQDLLASVDQAFAAYDALASGVLLLDAQARVLAMNSAAQDLWSVSHKAMLGQSVMELFESHEALERAVQGARRHGTPSRWLAAGARGAQRSARRRHHAAGGAHLGAAVTSGA
ncbi:MAG: PAS domain-containing protein [Burkholderiaceae bacterium]